MRHSELVCVKKCPGKGRGVFARKSIKKGDTIEHVPLLFVPAETMVNGLDNDYMRRYYYCWTSKRVAVALGYGSLYNHSYQSNAEYKHGSDTIKYVAIRNIAAGEEITINYNGDPKDKSPVGFKVMK
jgi:SET domain-containing protein